MNRGYTWARVEASADLEYGYGPGDDDDDDIGRYGANRVQLGWSDWPAWAMATCSLSWII